MTEQARKLFNEGVAAFEQSRWAEARAAFLAALALNGHYTIRGNLAAAELKLGRYRDATAHLARCVREMAEDTTSTAEERARAEAAYAKAQAKVGTLVVHTNVDGARVFVDGAFRGVTPLPDPLFVEPGVHKIMLEHEDYETQKLTSQLGAGGTIEHRMPMLRRPAGTPAPKPPETTATPPAARSWVPVVALGAASAVGLGVAVGFTVASNNASADVDRRGNAILQAGGQCSKPSAAFVSRCDELDSSLRRIDTFGNGARLAYVASGALAITAAAYALWGAPREMRTSRIRALPELRTDGAGFAVLGVW